MTWAEVVGRVPAKIITWAAIVALLTFVVLAAITIIAYGRGDSITVANLEFGKTRPSVHENGSIPPSGAIVAYESKCPDGWTPYDDARGRFLIGAQVSSSSGSLSSTEIRPYPSLYPEVDILPGRIGGTQLVDITFNAAGGPNFIGQAPTVMANSTVMAAGHAGRSPTYFIVPPYLAVVMCKQS